MGDGMQNQLHQGNPPTKRSDKKVPSMARIPGLIFKADTPWFRRRLSKTDSGHYKPAFPTFEHRATNLIPLNII